MTMIINFLTYNLLLFLVVFLTPGKIINDKNVVLLKDETNGFIWNTRLVIVLFLFMVVAGVREPYMGTDYIGYLDFYTYILNHGYIGSHFQGKEIGWDYLNLLFAKLGIPAEIFFGLIAGVMWYFFIKGSYKYQFLLPLMLFFVISSSYLFWTFSGIRQSIAIMIFFYAIKFIIEKQLLHYVSFIFIASLFHTSVLILLPVYLFWKIKFSQKFFFILYIVSILLMGNDWFLSQIGNIITILSTKFDFISHYLFYIETSTFTVNEERTSSGLGVILKIMTTLYILYKSKFVLEKQPKLTIYFVLFMIGSILANIFFSIEIIGRVLTYFQICFPIVIASTVYYSTKKYEKIIAILLMTAYILVMNVQIYRWNIIG